ncbi:MAG TPA: tripartite tricarboxylate transporter substrate binding protein, partial [Variovorax sp.]|nr:tripartite tricarboxylate transporter substrate binding protein [Variovorax sp.]
MHPHPSVARRAFITAAIASAATAAVPANAQAQAWPNRPVKLIVPYAAGGGTDVIARNIATRLSAR